MTVETIEKDKTLLVDGPARVCLLSGKASVLGAQVRLGEGIVVRKGKRLPLEALLSCDVELTLGESASYTKTDGTSIPVSWQNAVNDILYGQKCETVLVMGGVDSGKTGFCTYLANLALNAGLTVALIDGDLGQSDLGPPGTASLTLIGEPIIDLFRLRSEYLLFIGTTSPSRKIADIVDALGTLKEAASKRGASLLIINTDGWVEGDDAASYKALLAKKVVPGIVVVLESQGNLAPVFDALGKHNFRVMVVDSPPNIKKRDRETRKLLRESAYRKYLREAKVRSFQLSQVQTEGEIRFNVQNNSQLRKRIEEALGRRISYCDETSNSVLFALEKETELGEEETKKLESVLEKRVVWLRGGDEEGALVALKNAEGRVVGVGTISSVDSKKGIIRICTAVEEAVSLIQVGMVKLDREGNEVGLIFENP